MADGIILIPGIKGTKLIDVNTYNYQYVWAGTQNLLQSITGTDTLESLELTLNSLFDEKIDTIINKAEIEVLLQKN